MAKNVQLKSLQRRERQIVLLMDSVERFVQNYEAERDECQIASRLEALEPVFGEFHEVRSKIEMIVFESEEKKDKELYGEAKEEAGFQREEENDKILLSFEDRFFQLKGALSKLQCSRHQPASLSESSHNHERVSMGSRVKLPEIRLPSFGGKLRDWVSFRDSFQSLIHNNEQLAPMEKFTYLRSALSGDALKEILSIELSDANYIIAWDILTERYENKKLIVKAYLDGLFSLESIRKEGYESINYLITEFEKNLMMLQKVGEDTDGWSTILAHMLYTRLDSVTLRNWETHHNSTEVPKYEDMRKFLRNYCSVLQSVAPAKEPRSNIADHKQPRGQSVCHTAFKSPNRCPFCTEPWHSPFHCQRFLRMKIAERLEAANRSRVCRNCLQLGHFASNCNRSSCRLCQQRHHTMLHATRSSVQNPSNSRPSQQSNAQPVTQRSTQVYSQQTHQQQRQHARPIVTEHPHTQTQNATHNSHNTTTQFNSPMPSTSQNYVALPAKPTANILLSTALIKIKDRHGNALIARALLDSCSQHCLMTREFSRKLKFKESPTFLSVQGIGSSQSVSTKSISAEVGPRSPKISEFQETMEFFVLPKLTLQLPTTSFDPSFMSLPDSALLADPYFHESKRIDIIIGAEYYLDLLKDERKKMSKNGPTLQNTVFGWIVSGRVVEAPSEVSHTLVCSTSDLQKQLTRFWELETCRVTSTHSIEESMCERIFKQTTMRDEAGRFVVTLPKKESVLCQLGDSMHSATKRFLALERRLDANPELKKEYAAFIHEYLDLGHMKEILESVEQERSYYMPHHAVLKPDSTTTKLRVVFDASCRTSTGISLNDALMVGPVVQDELVDIILRFRLHRYAVVADVAKMYRMVRVQESDQPLQRILWRDSSDDFIRIFQLTTVTYGTSSAPYLATRCLQELANQEAENCPIASEVLKKSFYVDDMLAGVGSVEEGKLLVREMMKVMKSAGMSLRKYVSNASEILEEVSVDLREERSVLELDSSQSTVKTLGLKWQPSSDEFQFSTIKWDEASVITKRKVLSDVARLFDPLGLVGPVVVQAKIFVQQLWKLQCDWDDKLTDDLSEQWREFRRNFVSLDSLSVPRWVGLSVSTQSVEIHGFCDASEKAYGACIYIRSVDQNGSVLVRLLTSKSRVAPLENLKQKKKKQSMPRLELSSALTLAHLYEKVQSSIKLTSAKSYFWTDSMIVKCWLASPPSRWKEFVANRVSEIQHITDGGHWNHVAGIENPADLISRGMTAAQLQYQTIWFQGPTWLQLDEQHWPKNEQSQEENVDVTMLEEKPATTATTQTTEHNEIFGLKSSYIELVRLVAWMQRCRFNSRKLNREIRKSGPLKVTELDESLKTLVRIAQQEGFAKEYADLLNNRPISNSSKIASLNPVMVDGLIRVGGRLRNAAIHESRKHPFILDHRHPFTTTVMIYYHQNLLHAGQQLLIASVRERFWPTNIGTLARAVIFKCVACFRVRPKIQEQLMADLPKHRVTQCPVFQKVGVDYCGPFYITYPQRKARPTKVFIAIYVCLVTKAVHIELAADLSTQAFLATFQRFCGRRSTPSLVMCDNAKNFVGAKRVLDEVHQLFVSKTFQDSVINYAADRGIDFQFIPARSPNFGGLWESAVKSFKTLLKRTIGSRSLVHEELQTIIVRIEAALNSRPLTALSNDPEDFEPLTPGHFLVQKQLIAPPEHDWNEVPENRLNVWQRMQQTSQQLWKKWSSMYLSDLHSRTKWTKQNDNIRVGMMVVLKEDNLPPLKWPIARIEAVHPGPDGNVRVVTVRTQSGSYDRAISKICILPINDNLQSQGQ
ncbi:uncharacterized protein LOC129741843 [Uranotaenia lowii]|uniref:uncharacterized protein LOC129741843 n=1 Tax=Uranotaenia lowii TaxID=190385 RepID=UPI00247B2693|nr:uncharacterized protein LOC129741843 [Uranotaenia lowii]